MKKTSFLVVMLMLIALLVSACKGPDPANQEPSESPSPSPGPTFFIPTPEPTIAPRQMEGDIEWAQAGSTPFLIDPVDRPTPKPIFAGDGKDLTQDVIAPGVGVQFKVPDYWVKDTSQGLPDSVVIYSEPLDDVRNGLYPASLKIEAVTGTSAQTAKDAEALLDARISAIRAAPEYLNVQVSSKANSGFLGSSGIYVTIRFDLQIEGQEDTILMRGRYLAVPVGKKVYLVQTMHPAKFNDEYDTNVYKKMLRESIKEL